MRFLLKFLAFCAVVGGIGAASYGPVVEYIRERNRPKWRTVSPSQGSIVATVNATGTVEPVKSVSVGTFVSGPIISLNVDFNDEVKEGDILAEIDPRIYDAAVARDQAALSTREAEVKRASAVLRQAENDERRAKALRADDPAFISDTEMDQFKFNRMSLAAQLVVAEAAVEQAKANLNNSQANLGYTKIRAPVSGMVIDRMIDPGQTLAAQFQTPELFIVAPDMRKEMHVFASVDETDIGLISDAQRQGKSVQFHVDAYPNDLFDGVIYQLRKASTVTQNVVTYPVVVSTANEDLKLLPGMTANISFHVGEVHDALRVPNEALRFYPPKEHVREADMNIIEGVSGEEDDDAFAEESMMSASEYATAAQERERRHVWIEEGYKLRAIPVVTGISDNKYTEIVSGDIPLDAKLVFALEIEE